MIQEPEEFWPATEETTNWENHYMHCGEVWTDVWTSQSNDDCPSCGREIEPYKSINIVDDDEIVYHVDEFWIPEGGWPEGCSSRED